MTSNQLHLLHLDPVKLIKAADITAEIIQYRESSKLASIALITRINIGIIGKIETQSKQKSSKFCAELFIIKCEIIVYYSQV